MALRSDQKALLFIGAVAVLGAGVRVVRAATGRDDLGDQPALQQQSRAADSASRAGRPSGKRAASRKSSEAKTRTPMGVVAVAPVGAGPLDRPGYVAGKLDLDIATAAQIDSLPGVGPAMAKRIVADRMQRGPFVTREGLRRVKGVGPSLLVKIEPFVMFSGVVKHPDPADTIIRKGAR